MSNVAIYCRVSSEGQERDGTSLQTQLEHCLKYCQDKQYHIVETYSEAYSGLSLIRPKLDQLRELVRSDDLDVVLCYSVDRLSRDPTHGVILTEEFAKHDVRLEAVSETVESSELGKLINYIRGFASKLEAEKIKERVNRGKRAKAQSGVIPGGGYHSTFGYDYVAKTRQQSARREINPEEAEWVKTIFKFCVLDGMCVL